METGQSTSLSELQSISSEGGIHDAKVQKTNFECLVWNPSEHNCTNSNFSNIDIWSIKSSGSFLRAIMEGLRHIKPNIHDDLKELESTCQDGEQNIVMENIEQCARKICEKYKIIIHIINSESENTWKDLVIDENNCNYGEESINCDLMKAIHLIKNAPNNYKTCIYKYNDKYNMKDGTHGLLGEYYKIYLIMYLFIDAKIKIQNKEIKKFYITSYMDLEDFCDVTFTWWYEEENQIKTTTLFFKLKHQEQEKKTTKAKQFIKSSKQGNILEEYFESFRKIKKQFNENKKKHKIFIEDFTNNTHFIIFRNGPCSENKGNYYFEIKNETIVILNFSNEKNYPYKIKKLEEQQIGLKNTSELPDDERNKFLEDLNFYFNQPNENKLKELVEERLRMLYPENLDIKNLFDRTTVKFLDWYSNDRTTYIHEDWDCLETFQMVGVIDHTPFFTGREKYLEKIDETLKKKNVIVIYGPQGIGKTELTRKYITWSKKKHNRNIICMDAENESQIRKSFVTLAKDNLKINIHNANNEQKDLATIKENVYNHLKNKSTLFIFDNADRTIEDFLPELSVPEENKNTYVLIASCNEEWRYDMPKIGLNKFDPEQSKEFIKKVLNIDRNNTSQDGLIEQLAKDLENFPLAVQLSVSHIKYCLEKNIEFYLRKLKDTKKSDLYTSCPSDFSKPAWITWIISMEAMKEGNDKNVALKILELMAYLNPENINKTRYGIECTEKDLNSAFKLLVELSIINEEPNKLKMHHLIQEFIRFYIDKTNRQTEILEKILDLFRNVDEENIEHAISAWSYVRKLNIKIAFKKYEKIPLSIMKILRSSERDHDARKFGEDMFEFLSGKHEMSYEYLCGFK